MPICYVTSCARPCVWSLYLHSTYDSSHVVCVLSIFVNFVAKFLELLCITLTLIIATCIMSCQKSVTKSDNQICIFITGNKFETGLLAYRLTSLYNIVLEVAKMVSELTMLSAGS